MTRKKAFMKDLLSTAKKSEKTSNQFSELSKIADTFKKFNLIQT